MPRLKRNEVEIDGEFYRIDPKNIMFDEIPLSDNDYEESMYRRHFHYFNEGIACEVGVLAATVLTGIAYNIQANNRNGATHKSGLTWCYDKLDTMLEKRHQYMTKNELRTAIKKLIEAGFIIRGNFNPYGPDRTMWYTIVDNEVRKAYKLPIIEVKNLPKQDTQERGISVESSLSSVESTLHSSGFHHTIPIKDSIKDSIRDNNLIINNKIKGKSPDGNRVGADALPHQYPSGQASPLPEDTDEYTSPERIFLNTQEYNAPEEEREEQLTSGKKQRTPAPAPATFSRPTAKDRLKGVAPEQQMPSPQTKPKKGVRLTPEEASMLDIVEYWNEKATMMKNDDSYIHKISVHKFDNSGYSTKTVREALRTLLQLKDGSIVQFHKNVHPVNAQSLSERFRAPMEKSDIKRLIDSYVLACRKDYTPHNKAYMPKSLQDFIVFIPKKGMSDYKAGESWAAEICENPPVKQDYDMAMYVAKVKEMEIYPTIVKNTKLPPEDPQALDRVLAHSLSEWKKMQQRTYMLIKDISDDAELYLDDPDMFFTKAYEFIKKMIMKESKQVFSVAHFVWDRPSMVAFRNQFSESVMSGISSDISNMAHKLKAKERYGILKKSGYSCTALDNGEASWYSVEDIEFAKEHGLELWFMD